ncbi:hypothetical protein PG999_004381 [Apiospora kogelbergensis]|uniref:Uncharacterized protein n=1 Tax=Apiospora kogelbergensis TaxID=1337665 RepID=A0AAW0QZ73_9PEZI
MTGLVRKGFYWSYDAADFLDMLYSGQLPQMIHPFFHKSKSSACLQGVVRTAAREALVRLECIRYEGDRHGLRRGVAVKRGAGGGRGNVTSLLGSLDNDGTTILQAKAHQTA